MVTRNKNGISNTFYLDTHSLNRYSCAYCCRTAIEIDIYKKKQASKRASQKELTDDKYIVYHGKSQMK